MESQTLRLFMFRCTGIRYVKNNLHPIPEPDPLISNQKQGERFEVLEGRVELSINGKKRVISAGDPEVTIQPYDIHGLQGFKGERLVIRERADTAGNYKAL